MHPNQERNMCAYMWYKYYTDARHILNKPKAVEFLLPPNTPSTWTLVWNGVNNVILWHYVNGESSTGCWLALMIIVDEGMFPHFFTHILVVCIESSKRNPSMRNTSTWRPEKYLPLPYSSTPTSSKICKKNQQECCFLFSLSKIIRLSCFPPLRAYKSTNLPG